MMSEIIEILDELKEKIKLEKKEKTFKNYEYIDHVTMLSIVYSKSNNEIKKIIDEIIYEIIGG